MVAHDARRARRTARGGNGDPLLGLGVLRVSSVPVRADPEKRDPNGNRPDLKSILIDVFSNFSQLRPSFF